MIKLEQAARQALGALEDLIVYSWNDGKQGEPDKAEDYAGIDAITALREALSQPNCQCGDKCFPIFSGDIEYCETCGKPTALAEQAKQEPCKECGAKQAQIDRLMLEYCPDEMTPEQMQEWEKNIKPFVEPVQQEPVAGTRCKIVESCKSCQHSFGRKSCALAERDFDSIERNSTPPEWCPLPLYATPVQQVDLTDDEKDEIECALNMAFDLLCKPVDSIAEMYCFGMGDCDEVRQQLKDARAVIAAYKEKNK